MMKQKALVMYSPGIVAARFTTRPMVLGDNEGHCVRLTNAGADSEWYCTFTIFFMDGQIHAHGPFNSGVTTCTITGGKGK